MFCQKCYQVTECSIKTHQPDNRAVYLEYPYMNMYIRERTCYKCGEKFTTYEIGEGSFNCFRAVVSMAEKANKTILTYVNNVWSQTKDEFFKKRHENNFKKQTTDFIDAKDLDGFLKIQKSCS